MNRAGKYVWNALILSGCTLLMRTVGVAWGAFCARRIGGEGMGLYSLVMSVYGFAVTVATSGVHLAATRLCALHLGVGEGDSARSAMKQCFRYAALFGSVASVGLFLFADFLAAHALREPRAAMSIRALSLSLLPLSLCSAFGGYFSAVRRVYKNAISQVLEQAVKIVACAFLLALLLPRGVEYACLALVLGGAISEISSFFLQGVAYLADRRKLPHGGAHVPFAEVAKISIPVAASAYVRSGLVTVEHILIPIGLAAFGEANALATYGVVSAIALPLVLYPSAFVSAFAGVLIPEITEFSAKNNRGEITYAVGRAYAVTLFGSLLCAGLLATFSGDLCRVIYGSTEAAIYVRVLAPLLPVMFLDTVTDAFLKGLGKQVYSMCVNIADAAASVLFVWLLVPKIGVWGYIVGIYITECGNAVASVAKLLSMAHPRPRLWQWLLAPLAAALAAGYFAVFFCERLPLPLSTVKLIGECLLYVLCYSFFCRLLGAVGREELTWAKSVAQGMRRETKKAA